MTAAEHCRSCHAPIRFIRMATTGKYHPLNAEPNPEKGNVVIRDGQATALGPLELESTRATGEPLYLSHFATCPQRQTWRKP